MPLIMNDEMELDINDLFDDGTGLSLQSRPPPKELFQRIDELRESGCCQAIAWSKLGCIASITQHGTGLEFRNLRCHPLDGSWDLSEPTVIPQIYPHLDGVSFQHLCWSPNGSDLAAIDASGRISVLSIGTFLNKPSLVKTSQADPAEDLNAVIGAYWINLLPVQSRPPIINSVAIKGDKGYRYEVAQAICFGPCYPNVSKSALVCLTTNGVLRLIWPQIDGKWHETTSEIESIVSSNDLITHASICADKNQTLLIAFATTSKQLRTVRAFIKWGNKPNDKGMNNAPGPVNPSIIIVHLAVGNWMDGTLNDASDSFHTQATMVALSHLEIISPTPDGPAGLATLPTILTVRSHLPTFPSQFNQDIYSTIDRWELRESIQSIHPAFEQLGSRRRSAGSQPGSAVTLRKLDGFTVNKVVLHVQSVALDRILCFSYSDGSLEYRDRVSLTETFTEGGLERFTHISQIGFSFIDDEPCLQVAISPSNCSFVQCGSDGKFKWRTLTHHMDQLGDSADQAQYDGVVAGLTMCCSAAVMSTSNYDDVLSITNRYTSQPTFYYDFLSDVSRVLKFHVDYSEESNHDTLIRNPSIQLCLSIQNSLGYKGDLQRRKFGANIAWISLQIRNCVVLMTMAANMKVPDPDHPQKKISGLEDAEAIRILSGSVRWCLDLMAWLVDCLLHPEDPALFKPLSTGQSIDPDAFNDRLHASNNTALHLLLSSAARGYLKAICRRLTNLDFTARKAMSIVAQSQAGSAVNLPQPLTSNSLRAAYTTIATLTSSAVIQISTFETFLTSISASIKDAYTSAGLASTTNQLPPPQGSHPRPATDAPRNSMEQIMLFGGPLPLPLIPAMRNIFLAHLPALRSDIDPARLFFHDFSLLALEPTPSSSRDSTPPPPAEQALASLNLLDSPRPNGKKSSDIGNSRIAHAIDIFQRIPVVLGQELDPAAIAAAATAAAAAAAAALEGGAASTANAAAAAALAQKAREVKRWRRCARCAAVMEDVQTQKPAVHFLIMQQRRCFCGGSWDIFTGKQIVA